MKSYKKGLCFILVALVSLMAASNLVAETIYVDSRTGRDANPGTQEKPLRTIGKAAEIVNSRTEDGPVTIKIAPGIYNIDETVVFEGNSKYTEKARLVIESVTLPDDPQWKPALMPVVLSTEDPRKPGELDSLTATYSITMKVSHVTIRGLKFLGNPLQRNWHCCISRIGEDLDDLVVTQCMFVGSRDALDIYCAALATGDRFVVDHCIFTNCHACVVFWDGPEGVPGEACAMRHCIVEGAHISGVWTCQTAEDFEFHHNIVTGSEYFWMRKSGDQQKYRLHDCIVVNNKYHSGYGVESGPTGQTGPEVTYEQENIIRSGKIVLQKDKLARDYLHVAKDSLGSELGAGLFMK